MKKLLSVIILLIFAVSLVSTAFAKNIHDSRVLDYADLLTPWEEAELKGLLDTLSEELQFDLVVVTEERMNGKSSQDYAADTYDYNNYGYGSGYDGALFLLNMEEREMYILGTGFGVDVMNEDVRDAIFDEVEYDVGEGYYLDAFKSFAEKCKYYVEYVRANGEYKEPFDIVGSLAISLIIGVAVGAITIGVMRSGMKTVRMQSGAESYIKQGSLNVVRSADLFLYSHVSRAAKPKENGSGGGSFRSSSGRSHSGGGRKF